MITATATEQTKAKDTQRGQSLLAQIKVNIEWDGRTLQDAVAICSQIYGCALEEITIEQAYGMLREIHRTSKPVEIEPHDGYCMTCGRSSSLRQCMRCRDGQEDGYRPRFHSIV